MSFERDCARAPTSWSVAPVEWGKLTTMMGRGDVADDVDLDVQSKWQCHGGPRPRLIPVKQRETTGTDGYH